MPTLLEEPTTTETPQRPRRRFLQAVIGLALLAFIVAAALYLTSDSFRNRVRLKVIHELELMTGGRVELASLGWNLSKLEIDVSDITIHGLEAPNEVPYAHVDHMLLRAKILSIMQQEIGLRYVSMQHPVIHIIAYPDGTTNQPTPKIKRQSKKNPVDELFDLRINRLEVANGLLIWNDRELPMNFVAENVAAGMGYIVTGNSYDAKLQVGKLNLNSKGSPNLVSQAEAEISLHPGSVDIKALHWSTAKSRFDLSGRVADFNNPRLEATYRASIDLLEAAQFTKTNLLKGGSLDVEGDVKASSSVEYSSTGKLHVKNVSWSEGSTHVSEIDAASNFLINPDRLAFPHLVAHLLGGEASGEAQISHWAASSKIKGPAQQGTAHLNLANLDVARIEAANTGASKIFAQLKIASKASGKVDLRWTGSPANAEAQFALDLAAPENVPASKVPVHGTINASYSRIAERIDVQQLNLAARATRLDAVGTLGATTNPNAALRVNLNTTDISEFTPMLRAGGYSNRLPLAVHGRASFSGIVNGKLNSPNLSGHLQVTNFDSLISLPGVSTPNPALTNVSSSVSSAPKGQLSQNKETQVHWDSLVADVSYSPDSASLKNLILKHGQSQISGNMTAGLVKGGLTETSSLTAHIKMTNADLRDLQSIAGLNYPVTGTVNSQMAVSGTKNDLRGGGDVQVKGGEIYGQPYRSLQAHLNVQGQEVQVTHLLFDMNGAIANGGAEYNFENKSFGFDLRGSNFNLAQFEKLFPSKIAVAGNAQFTLNGSGTFEQPSLNANLLMQGVKLNGQSAGDITIAAVTRGTGLHLTGRSSLQNSALALDGDIDLQGDFPGDLKMKVAGLDLNAVLNNYGSSRYPLHTSASGTIAISGPFKQPRALSAVAEFPQFTANMENVSLQNDGPVRLALRNQAINIEQLHITGTDTDLTAEGSVDLTGAQAMRIRANGHVNLKLLQSFDPNVIAYGLTDFVLNAAGTVQRPDLNGQINIHNAGISVIDAPNGLSEMNGTLVFEQDRVRVQKLTALTGGGTLDLGGFITYNNGIYFDLTGSGRDVRLRYPEGTSSQGNADLRLVGTTRNALLTGDVLVTRFGISPHFDLALTLAKAKQPPTPPNPDSVIDNIRLDVHITSTPELRVETSLAKLAGDVDLRVKGTVARPTVLGRVNIAEGDIFFNNTKYHLERGDVLFANPVKIEPVLNVEASTHVRDYDISLGFHGTPDKLSTTYRSDPPLPSADIIQLLAFGQTREEGQRQREAAPQTSDMASASNAILGSALNAVVSSRVQKLFGISKVKIDPTANAVENPNAQLLTIEQQISNRVTITYRTNFTQSEQQVISIEYNINPNVSLLAVRDQYGVFGLDVRIRQRKR